MSVKIVTDSVADIPPQVASKLGITVVPLVVSFGTESYRDGIDLTSAQFYEKLETSEVFPKTSVPPPIAFTEACDRLAEETEEILIITVTSKLSAVSDMALQGTKLMKKKCRVEIVDSRLAVMAEGFIVIKAAQAARSGASMEELLEVIKKMIPRVEILGAFDTLEYLKKGGRIGAAKVFLGSLLNINPLISLKDGVVNPAGRTRSRARAIDCLYEFVKSYSLIEELAIENTACPEEAEALIDRIDAIFPDERIYRCKMTPVIGTHTGPGLLLVSVMGDK